MTLLATALHPLARPGRFLARLVFPGRTHAGPPEGRLRLGPRRSAETGKPFLGYLKDALSGGGRR
jgi:hypothetical protein